MGCTLSDADPLAGKLAGEGGQLPNPRLASRLFHGFPGVNEPGLIQNRRERGLPLRCIADLRHPYRTIRPDVEPGQVPEDEHHHPAQKQKIGVGHQVG